MEELREEAGRIQAELALAELAVAELAVAELAVAERERQEWAIARSRVGEVLAPADETGQDHARADLTVPAAEEQSGKTAQVPEAAKSQVPVWGAACSAACSVSICERCPHRRWRHGRRRGSGLLGDVLAEVEVGTLDLFRDEDIEYARRLNAAAVPTELHVHPGVPHAFDALAPAADVSMRSTADRIRIITSF
ncbi:alpha/beta hydrolase [Streptomyces sp. NBC_01549]|uniref:alpha/beta hydrolase n=1 Tax=Streptomyces sp. NBC_01549 TaxID=2975874 RepID=UPI00225C3340|nr:alpha/beta hydrolase fold domain-containing protein [Streptomyces sp. NBC_01549]MCX4597996.1 alpha/beta hydrolase [Streptomyces sp. NBC_01549]